MPLIRGLVSSLLLLSVVVLALFIGFTWEVFSVKPKDAVTDAVVVLAGGKGRIEEGVRLFRAGGGGTLYLIGADPAVRLRDLVKVQPGEQIVLEHMSRNTLENALYARGLLAGNNARSLQLITSRYHMPRARLMFRTVLPKDMAIYPHPVDSRNLKEEWWRDGGSFRLLFSEFYKYYLYRLFFAVASGDLRGGTVQVK